MHACNTPNIVDEFLWECIYIANYIYYSEITYISVNEIESASIVTIACMHVNIRPPMVIYLRFHLFYNIEYSRYT